MTKLSDLWLLVFDWAGEKSGYYNELNVSQMSFKQEFLFIMMWTPDS